MATINGTDVADDLQGTELADQINSLAGDDTIRGGDGDDDINGGSGNDAIFGEGGNDTLFGSTGDDSIHGGPGNDTLTAGLGADSLFGEEGNDFLYGDRDAEFLDGGPGDDFLIGDSGNDVIVGGDGIDQISGGNGDDTMDGGPGNDSISGDAGNDTINGGAGDDRVFAGSGNDLITYVVGQGADLVIGGKDVDTLRLEVTSQDLPSVRDEILEYAAWLEGQVSAAGGELAYGNLSIGQTFKFSFGLTVSTVEKLEISVDGKMRDLASLSNSAPVVAEVQSLSGTEDQPIVGNIGASDPDGDAMNYELISGPANGELAFNAETGAFSYFPASNYAGADSFSVLVSDGQGGFAEQRVDIAVAGKADDPTLSVAVPQTGTASVMQGTDGNDVIIANRMAADNSQTYALAIEAGLTDTDGSETLAIAVAGMPEGAVLSAGAQQEDGTWLLSADQLEGLSVTLAVPGEVTLDISAISTESNGDTAVTSQTVSFGTSNNADDNFIDAGAGNDYVRAGRGDDVVIGGQGNDFLYGGRGNDTLDYSTSQSSVWVNLKAHKAFGEDSGFDHVRAFENVTGTGQNDRIIGNNAVNNISGGAGNDIISGGRGADVLAGGEGADSFSFHRSDVISGRNHHGVDTITDFDEFDTLDFSELLRGGRKAQAGDSVTATVVEGGTLISVEMGGRRGSVDVVFLEGVTDFDLDQISVERGNDGGRGNAFGHYAGGGSTDHGSRHDSADDHSASNSGAELFA